MTQATAYTTVRLFLDGMLCMMMVYALLSYFQQRKSIYWQYSLYILCMVITFRIDDADYRQVSYQPGANYWAALVETMAFILYIRFAVLLIDIPGQDPFSYRVLLAISLVLGGGAVLDTCLWLAHVSDNVRSSLYTLNRFSVAACTLLVVPRILRLRQPVVNYFIVGSLLFTAGCVLALVINFIPQFFTRQPANPFSYPITVMQIGVVGEVLCFTLGMSLRNRQNEQEKIQYQSQLIEQLRENERKQDKLQRIRDDIARDLHDDVGSDLGSIGLLSQVAARQLHDRPDQALATLLSIGQTARHVVTTMREIIWSISAAQTSLASFSHRLQEMAELLFEHQVTQLHLQLPADDLARLVPAEGRRDLFLMVKEMLYNVIRHANAQHVYVTMWVEANTLHLTVRDDGRGFQTGTNSSTTGNGLRSLQKRADALNGYLSIDARVGSGTTLTVKCPLMTEEVGID